MTAYWPKYSFEQEVSIFSSIIFRSFKGGSLPRKLVFWGRMRKETRNQSGQKIMKLWKEGIRNQKIHFDEENGDIKRKDRIK